ncbi:class I SAM-dependent methyltransferase [Waterburya agarophytonicola K14]|uniref:Class I SAM-dependent methyltransferase n=1 Tax=Waterburya agarophytonicola KI4 TaxID=2874699 RepID=A0A964BR20_9CYAN|nr:class I SAM-dependent methyltransferase [Waterburya agarophytonicola]MCC0177654.1 class I SAM-dependent methyltransferase [Waterburya agarophytonicola KI4]
MADLINQEAQIQREYYAQTAQEYEKAHVNQNDEHFFALSFMLSTLDYLEVKSILDVGSGTGRTIKYIKKHRPAIEILGIEPVAELRDIAYTQGISKDELIPGDATNLSFQDNEFDLVCEFGVLHHIKKPEIAVSEMLRVAKKSIFISDNNHLAHGSPLIRLTKYFLHSLGLWKLAHLIKTKGRGFTISKGDGLSYPYTVFDNYEQIEQECQTTHLLSTKQSKINLYRTASHIALLGIK